MKGANAPQKTLPRVRTYAHDLEAERARRGQPSTSTPTATAAPVPDSTQVPIVEPAPATPTTNPKPLPPSNPTTSTPLITKNQSTNDRDFVAQKSPTLSASVAAAVLENSKQKSEPAPTTPTVIPAFHELTKQRAETAPTKSGLTSTPTGYSATIITDTRSDRFLFLPKLFSSISNWWSARAKRRAAARAPKYVIPETDRRKGVIQRATSQTAKVTTGDYEGLRQRLKERVEVEATAPAEAVEDTETFWTPHIEPIFPLLSAPQYTESSVQNITLTPRRRREETDVNLESPKPTAAIDDERWEAAAKAYTRPPAPVTPEIVPPPAVEVFVPPPVAAPAAPPPTPKPVAPALEPTPEPLLTTEEGGDMDEDAPLPAPKRSAPSTNPKQRPEPKAAPRQFFFHTNTLTISIVGVVLLGSLVVYATPRVMPLFSRTATEPPVVTSDLIAAPVVERNLPTLEREALITALNIGDEERSMPAVEIQINNDTSPSATTILTTLDPSLPPSIAQNISDFSFGWYEKTEPFIVLTVSDRTSVWGGLLQHEKNLVPALSPFFSSATNTTNFVDRTVGGHDVRTALGPAREERLTYGMIDDHTLIITTTNAAFLSIETLVTTVR